MSDKNIRFGFGKNWEKYLKEHFSEERVEISQNHILEFLGVPNLKGKSFLDIGCGSGLHSLAALKSGAEKIVSFDYDQNSVNATLRLKKYAGDPSSWEVFQGSILDRDFIKTLEPANIVYSWGVLHHTGSMWEAIENTKQLMLKDSLLYLSIYCPAPYFGKSMAFWVDVKKRYNESSWLKKKQIEWWYFWEFYLKRKWGNLPMVIQQAREYKKNRGMDMYRDAVDWLGGYPFEYASEDEVVYFAQSKMNLETVKIISGQACIEYLFQFPKVSESKAVE
jgi:2-polyprenyl-6-hydroxyphenyl methylase/3-demethylubiquinone-9 3-methyltransferase